MIESTPSNGPIPGQVRHGRAKADRQPIQPITAKAVTFSQATRDYIDRWKDHAGPEGNGFDDIDTREVRP